MSRPDPSPAAPATLPLRGGGQAVRDAIEPLWVARGGAFAYSDGDDVEAGIYAAVKAAEDRSVFSPELRAGICDWPTEYHFSPLRGNLLRHLGIGPQHTVLELGGGCGAVTRFLGETGAAVTSVEGSLARARCAAARCHELDNVAVHCGPFAAFEPTPTFDFVLLIGVLEYAPRFYAGPDPLGQCLDVARGWLKPGGELIVAIENQLGLKYLYGAPEDHRNRAYHGVANAYRADEPVTLGRAELEKQIRACGLPRVRFEFPFPDYKLPAAVLTQAGLDDDVFDASDVLRHLRTRGDFQAGWSVPFDGRRTWPVAVRNGLAGELSNSFLVRASHAESESAPDRAPEMLMCAYAADRAAAYATRTCFDRDLASGTVAVRKERLFPQGAEDAAGLALGLRLVTGPGVYRTGRLLETDVADAIDGRDRDALGAALGAWRDVLLARAAGAGRPAGVGSRVPADALDLIPRNLVRDAGGGLAAIDQEWELRAEFTVNSVMLRYLSLVAPGLNWASEAGGGPAFSPRAVAQDLGLDLGAAALGAFGVLDDILRSRVTPWRTRTDPAACFGA